MSLQQVIHIALIAFIISNASIVAAIVTAYYQVVKCPDLQGNMINYPEGTKCISQEDQEEEDNNKDDN